MTSCPRCGEPLASGQEYCLVCGARISDGRAGRRGRRAPAGCSAPLASGSRRADRSGARGRRDRERRRRATMTTAIGGFATAPDSTTGEAPVGPSGVAEWPTDEDGWTIALASLPQTAGRAAALTRARTARRKGLPQVGVLDSSRYASLHPGVLDRVLGRLLVRGRGDERARGRSQGVANGCRPSRRTLIGRCLRRHDGPDFVTPPKRRYTLRAKRRLRSFFAQ